MPLSIWIGVALALASFAYVVYPLVAPKRAGRVVATVPGRDVTDEEIEAAVRSYRARAASGASCPACGARPEPDALFCSSCGRRLNGGQLA